MPWTREPWPLDDIELETLKEQHAKRNPEDLEIDYGTCYTCAWLFSDEKLLNKIYCLMLLN